MAARHPSISGTTPVIELIVARLAAEYGRDPGDPVVRAAVARCCQHFADATVVAHLPVLIERCVRGLLSGAEALPAELALTTEPTLRLVR